jgi:hypothetical protein
VTSASARLLKEWRALDVAWAAGMLSVLFVGAAGAPIVVDQATLIAIALGAWSVGHEYSLRTLPVLLVQPVSRTRLWLEKSLVLVVLVGALVAAVLVARPQSMSRLLMGTGVAVTVTPWLTMWSRSARAGFVLTIAAVVVPLAALHAIGRGLVAWRPDVVTSANAFVAGALQWVPLALVAAGIASWRMFARLEAVEEPSLVERGDIAAFLPSLTRLLPWRRRATRPHRPIRSLIGKELALQQPVLLISALYVLIGWLDGRLNDPANHQAVMVGATVLHGGTVALLAGATASAEERRLGTLEWQVLLPVAFWKQWLVKVAVTMGVGLGLAGGLPAVLAQMNPTAFAVSLRLPDIVWPGLIVLVVAALYVSSLCRNAVHAVLISLPAAFVALQVMGALTLGSVVNGRGLLRMTQGREYYALSAGLVLVALAGYLALVLTVAAVNHRASLPTGRRLTQQIIALAVYPLAAALLLQMAAGLILRW